MPKLASQMLREGKRSIVPEEPLLRDDQADSSLGTGAISVPTFGVNDKAFGPPKVTRLDHCDGCLIADVDQYDGAFRAYLQRMLVATGEMLQDSGLKVPSNVSLEASAMLLPGMSGPRYMGDSVSFPMSSFWFGASKKPLVREALSAVFLHEYGHAVFEENIFARMPGEAAGHSWGQGARSRSHILFRFFRDFFSGFLPSTFLDMSDDLFRGMAQNSPIKSYQEQRTSPINEVLDQFENAVAVPGDVPIRLIESDYNELFADTVAVLQLDDGKAISGAMKVLGVGGAPARDWTIDHRNEKFGRRDPHVSLAPTRSFIWETHQKYPGLSRGKILGALFDAIHSEISNRKNRGEVALPQEEMNRRLIDALQRRLTSQIREHQQDGAM